jgi:hypothetical protein
MTTHKLLSREVLQEAFRLVLLGDRDAMQAIQGHIAALDADNAALHDALEALWRSVPHAHFNATGVKALLDSTRPGTALLEEHRKALARARNKGLERAADVVQATRLEVPAPGLDTIAARIRALKEPEE